MKVRSHEEEEKKNKKRTTLQQLLQSSAMQSREPEEGNGGGGRKTVVVGIRMDSQSKELLTWALVKAASPGDLVIALHVLSFAIAGESPDVDKISSSPLLSLVKDFDSLLAVYDGFCNLNQIELKMKICRRSSIREVLVHEARYYGAARLILGVSKNVCVIGSSCQSVAKYCEKKLSPECAVLAVNNGKVLFERERFSVPRSTGAVKEKADDATLIVNAHTRQSTKSSNTSSSSLWRSFAVMRRNPCHATAADNPAGGGSCSVSCFFATRDKKTSGYREHMKEVPAKKREAPLISLSAPCDVVGASSCWPFLRRAVLADKGIDHLGKKSPMSVTRKAITNPDAKVISERDEDILVGADDFTSSTLIGKEEGKALEELNFLGEKYASVCRLFSYEELKHITGNFSPGEGCNKSCLSWRDRYKVAIGVAEALDYLHCTDNGRSVIHRDVKSSNILLNDDFDPQLSDFGLAMWASDSVSQLTCNEVAGTIGYLAPEYFMYGKINEKTDVYAFGVVLLELVSGRKPVSTGCPEGEESLVMWAMSILRGGKFKQLLDPCLGTDYDEDQLQRMILAASLCIKRAPRSRPRMTQVLKLLRGDGEMLKWATSQAGTLEEVDDEATLSYLNNTQSHIKLALLEVDDDSMSVSSTERADFLTANKSLEEYLQERWSRSSSFD